jgi:hypothetical protein
MVDLDPKVALPLDGLARLLQKLKKKSEKQRKTAKKTAQKSPKQRKTAKNSEKQHKNDIKMVQNGPVMRVKMTKKKAVRDWNNLYD